MKYLKLKNINGEVFNELKSDDQSKIDYWTALNFDPNNQDGITLEVEDITNQELLRVCLDGRKKNYPPLEQMIRALILNDTQEISNFALQVSAVDLQFPVPQGSSGFASNDDDQSFIEKPVSNKKAFKKKTTA